MKNISTRWLLKHEACEEGVEWFKNCGETEVKRVLAKLRDDEQFDYAIWLIKRVNTKRENVRLAIYCAELCLHRFEERYPNDKRPRNAIKAAKRWLKNPTEANRLKAWSAAWSAAESAAWSAPASEASWSAAAWSAWSAARSAAAEPAAEWSAARSAAEWSEWSAAESAAWSAPASEAAWSKESARSEVYEKIINYEIRILRDRAKAQEVGEV